MIVAQGISLLPKLLLIVSAPPSALGNDFATPHAARHSRLCSGMDKMVIDGKNDVVITNDGATILKKLQVNLPSAWLFD